MRCPSCGHENREAARFCEECGTTPASACPSCGAELRPSARFCDSCGQPVAISLVGAQRAVPSGTEPPSPQPEPTSTAHPERVEGRAAPSAHPEPIEGPTSFASGRYEV